MTQLKLLDGPQYSCIYVIEEGVLALAAFVSRFSVTLKQAATRGGSAGAHF